MNMGFYGKYVLQYLLKALGNNNETLDDIVAKTEGFDDFLELEEDIWFEQKLAFTIWTKNFVYFPAGYDGDEWIASVPRNPCNIKTPMVGGG